MSGSQTVTLCVGLANAVSIILVAIFSYILFNKKEKIYLKRQEAIYRALELCDKYLSWLNYYNTDKKKNPDPTRNLADTTLYVTEEARAVYNNLLCSCKSKDLIDAYLDLVVRGSASLDKYNRFRNLCREELGLKELDNLSEKDIFFSTISTNDLTKHSQNKAKRHFRKERPHLRKSLRK